MSSRVSAHAPNDGLAVRLNRAYFDDVPGARERMGPERSAAVDAEVRALVTPYVRNGKLVSEVVGTIEWGKPRVLP